MTGAEADPGRSAPLGATVRPDGANFWMFSKSATRVDLLLFEHYSSSSGGSGRADSRLRATKPTAVQAISRSRRTSV